MDRKLDHAVPKICYVCCAPTTSPHELVQHGGSKYVRWKSTLSVYRCDSCARRMKKLARGNLVLGLPLLLLVSGATLMVGQYLQLAPQWGVALTLLIILYSIGLSFIVPHLWLSLVDRDGGPLPPSRWLHFTRVKLSPEPCFNNPEFHRKFQEMNPRQ